MCRIKTVSDCIPIFFISPAFELALPCFLEEGVLVNVTMRWSQFQQDGHLIWRIFDFQFYRDCTPNIPKATTTTGLCESWSIPCLMINVVFHRGR